MSVLGYRSLGQMRGAAAGTWAAIKQQAISAWTDIEAATQAGVGDLVREINEMAPRGRAAQQAANDALVQTVRAGLQQEIAELRAALDQQIALRPQAGARMRAISGREGGPYGCLLGERGVFSERGPVGGGFDLGGGLVDTAKQFVVWGTIFGLYVQGTQAVGNFTKALYESNASYEQTRATLETLYGSGGSAQHALDRMPLVHQEPLGV